MATTKKRQRPGVGRERQTVRQRRQTLSLLFMDLSGWSSQDPRSVAAYLKIAPPRLDELLREGGASMVNTWGDAVAATFESPLPASETALRIRDFFRESADSRGVASGLSPRTALHVGDVVLYQNPITRRMDFTGDAVNRCARVEPITPPGYVFCTEDFARMLTSDLRDTGPKALPLERRTLPKNAGEELVHVVTWPGEPDPRKLIAAGGTEQAGSPVALAVSTSLDLLIAAAPVETPSPRECTSLVELYWVGMGPVVWVNPERTPGIDSIVFHLDNRLGVNVEVDAIDLELVANNLRFLCTHRIVRVVADRGRLTALRINGLDFSEHAASMFREYPGDAIVLNATVKLYLSSAHGEFDKHARIATWVPITKKLG